MRREFPARVKVEAFDRAKGLCEECGTFLRPGRFAYDHVIADGLLGTPTLENCKVLCDGCHATKTKDDVKKIAKAKRLEARAKGVKKPRSILGWRKFSGEIVRKGRDR